MSNSRRSNANSARAVSSINAQPGQHDDLAMSLALLAWAAQHLHLDALAATGLQCASAAAAAAKFRLVIVRLTPATMLRVGSDIAATRRLAPGIVNLRAAR